MNWHRKHQPVETSMARAILNRKVRARSRPWARSIWMLGLACSFFGLIGNPSPGIAQMMLYEDRLPDGYAYVRFVNTTSEPMTLRPAGFADQMKLGVAGADRVSNYFVVENVANRKLTMQIEPSGGFTFALEPGALHTVLIETINGAIMVKTVTDHFEMSQTKAQLSFYNATAACADAALYLEPGDKVVFKNVNPSEVRGRVVNPSTDPTVRAMCEDKSAAILPLGALNAGGQYSIWLIQPKGQAETFLASAKFAPYQR